MNTTITWISRGDKEAGLIIGYLRCASILLFLTAAVKLVSVVGEADILSLNDPLVTVLSNRQMLFIAAVLELGVARSAWRMAEINGAVKVVAWLSTLFLSYRVGLWWMGYDAPCSCLGAFTEAVWLSQVAAERIAAAILAYLFIGSYGIIVGEWVRQWHKLQKGQTM